MGSVGRCVRHDASWAGVRWGDYVGACMGLGEIFWARFMQVRRFSGSLCGARHAMGWREMRRRCGCVDVGSAVSLKTKRIKQTCELSRSVCVGECHVLGVYCCRVSDVDEFFVISFVENVRTRKRE